MEVFHVNITTCFVNLWNTSLIYYEPQIDACWAWSGGARRCTS